MKIDILTLFPEMFTGYLADSILGRAREAGLVQIELHNIRDYTTDKHHVTDDTPYGGGGGMILKPDPIFAAAEAVQADRSADRIILMTPQGRPFSQQIAQELAQESRLLLICGRYEGVDERVRQHLVTDEISIGDYVLTGGELAAMVVTDAVTRLLPGVLGAADAAATDSHATGLLEGPHYTRPETFRNWSVPPVLRSGHAANIDRWRREQGVRRTWERRPELLLTAVLTAAEKQFLAVLAEESAAALSTESPEPAESSPPPAHLPPA